jgi:hypothetical protein
MALAITRLSGGNTPASGSDPRTYPAIWNATATALEALELDDLTGVIITTPGAGQVLQYDGSDWVNVDPASVTNTDGDPGTAIYVGSVDPDGAYTLAAGDVWIEAI